jgi:hypoxanthine phosphoribosyltransferase
MGGTIVHNDIKEVLITEEQIINRCKELGETITKDYENKNPLLVGLLKGSIPFIGDIAKFIDTPVQIDYMDVSSYHGTTESSGSVKILSDLDSTVNGRHVLIVEDIVDTGRTLKYVHELLVHRGAESVKVVTMLDKPEGRVVEFVPEYIGFTIPNKFVVGYGLDYDEYYRNLSYVGILKEEVYTK